MDPISKLLDYINKKPKDATYYRLAIYTLEHIKEMANISISDFADAVYVSNATITRFTHFLGFENFNSFKKYFNNLSHTSKNAFLKLSVDQVEHLSTNPQLFFEDYCQKVIQSIEEMKETIAIEEVDQLISKMNQANNVAILGYSDANVIAKDIQLGCLSLGKIIDVVESTEKFESIINHYTKDDLMIILSNYGNFFRHFAKFYEQITLQSVPLVLVTQNYNSMDSFNYSQVIYLSAKRSLAIGNYPLRIFSEYLIRRMYILK